ncbi:GIY-YIG nuclease family protein [Flavobacterium segetis]|uniref:hypothetical protein n=1 Tax=Flavobacterium segetis TaxID=271157 RepID=UPI001F1F762F
MERFKTHNELGTEGHTLKFRPRTVIHIEFFSSKYKAIKKRKVSKNWSWQRIIQQIVRNQ